MLDKVSYDKELISYITLFENVVGVNVKDVYVRNRVIVYIVEKGLIGRAIGKKGGNIKKMENMMKKKIKIIEFDEDVERFVKNLILPIDADEISLRDNVVYIKVNGFKNKGLLIGRDSKNLNELKSVVKRYFNVDVKII